MDRHEANLKALQEKFRATSQGVFDYTEKADCVYLSSIVSIEKGSGTQAMRCLVARSLEIGHGQVKLGAGYSSHLFYLRMGMIPVDTQLDYINKDKQRMALTELSQTNDDQSLQPKTFKILKKLLGEEKNIEDEISEAMVIEEKPFLLSLLAKKISYLHEIFIPKLLRILKENKGVKNPDTSSFSDIPMVLSEEGRARWQTAIDNEKEFEPFRDFAQLRKHMTPEQIEELDAILAANLQEQKVLKTIVSLTMDPMLSATAMQPVIPFLEPSPATTLILESQAIPASANQESEESLVPGPTAESRPNPPLIRLNPEYSQSASLRELPVPIDLATIPNIDLATEPEASPSIKSEIRQITPEENTAPSYNSTLLFCSGLLAVAGATAILLAFIAFLALNATTFGGAGLICVSMGTLAVVAGIGFFACNIAQEPSSPRLRLS